MNDYGLDYEPVDEEQVIEEFLGENPRAKELRQMREALQHRKEMFLREKSRLTSEREQHSLALKLAEVEKQIAAIREEEAITTFVEDSVRVTLHKPSLHDLDEEF